MEPTQTCPACHVEIVPLPIVYGYPGVDLWEAEQAGRLKLGGCIIGYESPDHACPKCDTALPFVNRDALIGIAMVGNR